MLQLPKPTHPTKPLVSLAESYELCRRITEKYSKTFYLGTLLMPKAKRQAIWAIYVWCRRTDELVDGPQARLTTPETPLPSELKPSHADKNPSTNAQRCLCHGCWQAAAHTSWSLAWPITLIFTSEWYQWWYGQAYSKQQEVITAMMSISPTVPTRGHW